MHSEARVAAGVAVLYLANIVTLVLNTLFLVLLTNYVSVEEVGVVAILNVLVVSVATLAVLALPVSGSGVSATPPAVTRFLSQYMDDGTGSARRVYLISLAICALVSVAVATILSYPPTASLVAGPSNSGTVFFAGLDAVVFAFAQLGSYALLGTGKATYAGRLIIASSALRYAAAATLLVLGASISAVFLGFIVGDLLLALLSNASAFQTVEHYRGGGADMRPVTKYMASVFFAALVGLAVSQTDKLLAFLQQGLGNLALYNVATVGAAVASFAPSAATNILVPALSSYGDQPEKKQNTLRNYTRFISVIAAPMGFGLAAVSPYLLRVFGDQYVQAAPLLSVISISIALTAIAAVYSSILLVEDKAHHFTISSLLALAALVGVAIITVPYIGSLGIALGRGAMLFVMLGSVAYFVWKSGMLVVDGEAVGKSLGASMIMAAIVFAVLYGVQGIGVASRAASVIGALIMIPVGFAIYLLIMKAMKGFNETDIEFIEALLPPKLRFISRFAKMLI